MPLRATNLGIAILLGLCTLPAFGSEPGEAGLAAQFTRVVRPFLETYCTTCHGGEKPKAEFDLSPYATLSAVVRDHGHWELVLERLQAAEMPPAKAERHPTPELRTNVIEWIQSLRRHEAQKNAGDPGPVLARRLSNAEYDYTIRDLTGVDLRPTREFPVDPANQAGFDNSGESLAMSPALLKKYHQAAQQVASHLALKLDGFEFAPHPMLVETDRDKYGIKRIVDFYYRQPTDYADYFEAAWRFQHRAELGRPRASLADLAIEANVSPKYLALVWSTLTAPKEKVGPIARLQAMWRSLAPPRPPQPAALRAGCEQMRDYVVRLREKLEWKFKNLQLKGVSAGGQAFIRWKNRQYATHRTALNRDALQIEGDPKLTREPPPPAVKPAAAPDDDTPTTNEVAAVADPELTISADPTRQAIWVAAFKRFCRVFPDAFYVSERGRMHLDRPKEKQDKGRLLSAGFHNMMGYFRDDLPLCELVLDERGRRELDMLWHEFHAIAYVPERQHAEFIFYERAESRTMKGPEFDFARSEDKDITSDEKIQRLTDVYLAKARESLRTNGGDPMVIGVIADHFQITSNHIRWIEKARLAAEPSHLTALVAFAERAYRRPLAPDERDGLRSFYVSLRHEGGLDHEEAMRDSIVSVLMSPHFCYRVDLVDSDATGLDLGSGGTPTDINASAGRAAFHRRPNLPSAVRRQESALAQREFHGRARPLSDYALASRLSYFLWSSMPDRELLARAAAGDLQRPDVLAGQARRMLQDPRTRGLAVEFTGNWLDFRRFEEHNAVDRERFATFNDDLRQAMFEEPVRFFLDVAQRNRPVLDFLYARDTFANHTLAKHYGIPAPAGGPKEWGRVADADAYGRGGLLPMSVFLTRNAPGLRTSPVKRGYWVVRRLLGERIPPPPAVVPELPHDEAKLGDLTLREVLAQHRQDPSCAACHARFDSFGLVFEGYGPVGEMRTQDLGGRPVDARAVFPGGRKGDGIAGLRAYLRVQRQDDFLDNLCRKLLAYGLGRTLILSDDATIEQMRAQLAADGYRFGSLVESIVTSPQFRSKRAADALAQR